MHRLFTDRRLHIGVADGVREVPFGFLRKRADLMTEGVQELFIEIKSDLQVFSRLQVEPHAARIERHALSAGGQHRFICGRFVDLFLIMFLGHVGLLQRVVVLHRHHRPFDLRGCCRGRDRLRRQRLFFDTLN